MPLADVNTLKLPAHLPDEELLFLTDIFPTGHMAAENCNIRPGDVVAVWGCGPVGLFAVRSAYLLGAAKVIAVDFVEGRLRKAREECGAETVNSEEVDVLDRLDELTGGRGPDACIDAVGMQPHETTLGALYDRVKANLMVATGRRCSGRRSWPAARGGRSRSLGCTGGCSTSSRSARHLRKA